MVFNIPNKRQNQEADFRRGVTMFPPSPIRRPNASSRRLRPDTGLLLVNPKQVWIAALRDHTHPAFQTMSPTRNSDRANARDWNKRCPPRLVLATLSFKSPEVTRRNPRADFIQPLKEHIVRKLGYGPSLEGASAGSRQTNANREISRWRRLEDSP